MFDVTMMNPPYSKGLWIKFVDKAISLDTPMIATINPDQHYSQHMSEFGERWRNVCVENGIVYRNDATHHFKNVTCGKIGVFVFDRNKPPNLQLIESGDTLFDSVYSKATTLDPDSCVLRGVLRVRERASGEVTLSDVITDTHTHPCITNCTSEGLTFKYCDRRTVSKKHRNQLYGPYVVLNRFFGTSTPDKTPAYLIDNIQDYDLGNNCIVFRLNDGETLESFISLYTNKVYRYVMAAMRNGGMDIQPRHLMRLRRLDLTRPWTDDQVYTELGLTNEEIQYVEDSVT